MNPGVWAGFFVLLLSLVLLVTSFSYPYKKIGLGLGPGFFPVWLSVILMVLSCFYIYDSFKSKENSQTTFPRGDVLRNILFILGCLVLFVVLISFIGFVLTGTLFLFLLLYRGYKWYANIAISLSVSVFLFWLFGSVLQVALPVNAFGW
ncbi:tripartite tricarboxylate transporter TctB family protein [Paenibacillus hamazuiensis]|uniref:tripartite tricarboxylate transporter TctB family protein n=1 Tax=Paenibacillus hamazuiensis TaxID=2936508 RepID=UPI00200F2ACE|nr:tripartite tricarboxylate transporter TctB family protein [Paenibacillus hamazuiensis]